MVTFVNVPVVPEAVSNVPAPLMPPLSAPLDSVNWPPELMVNTPANVALPLSVKLPSTFMSSIDSTAPDTTETFAATVIEWVAPESV